MAKTAEPCPVEEAIRIIGGKWKLLILRSLLLNGPQRSNEWAGTVARDSGTSQMARYDLTKLGTGLIPTFRKLLTWGTKLPASRELPELSHAHFGSLTDSRTQRENRSTRESVGAATAA